MVEDRLKDRIRADLEMRNLITQALQARHVGLTAYSISLLCDIVEHPDRFPADWYDGHPHASPGCACGKWTGKHDV